MTEQEKQQHLKELAFITEFKELAQKYGIASGALLAKWSLKPGDVQTGFIFGPPETHNVWMQTIREMADTFDVINKRQVFN